MFHKNDLENLIIVSSEGKSLALRELAEIKVSEGPNLISRENMQYTLDILGFSKDRALSKVNNDIKAVINQYQLPTGYTAQVTGQQDDMNDALTRLAVALVFAVAFIYLLLVSQFKSLIHPITIMISLPLELVGVVAALVLTNTYLSMPAMMGLILLSGIAVNDAIHLIDFAIGTEQYSPLAKVVMGGLFSSTMLLLIFVPVIYSLFEDLKRKIYN
jgi:multidrug efflux pump subunit AcrB